MQAGLIVGGWDPYDGGQIYEIPLGKNFVRYFESKQLIIVRKLSHGKHATIHIYMYIYIYIYMSLEELYLCI